MPRKRDAYPPNPVAVRATKTDLSCAGSAFRKTAASANIDKQIGASNQLTRVARSFPPHQPSAAPAASESRLPKGRTQRAIVGTENMTHPTRNATPAIATEMIAGSIQRLGKNKIRSGQNK